MSAGQECPDCFEGETGFPPFADTCSTCHGSGFVKPSAPAFVPDTRAEQRGEK